MLSPKWLTRETSSTALAREPLGPAKLVPLPITRVRIEDKFWAPRIEVNRRRTLETVHGKLLETGAIQNFGRPLLRMGQPRCGQDGGVDPVGLLMLHCEQSRQLRL